MNDKLVIAKVLQNRDNLLLMNGVNGIRILNQTSDEVIVISCIGDYPRVITKDEYNQYK